jgi:hypothetical protein
LIESERKKVTVGIIGACFGRKEKERGRRLVERARKSVVTVVGIGESRERELIKAGRGEGRD